MKLDSYRSKAIIDACNRGYKIDKVGTILNPKGNIVKGCILKSGYKSFGIRIGKKSANIYFHDYQCFFKYGYLLFMTDCVRHLDNNKLNNTFDNIEIGTWKDNNHDNPKEVVIKNALMASSLIVKYHNVDEIRSYYSKSHSYKDTMIKFNINSKGTLYWIINKRILK